MVNLMAERLNRGLTREALAKELGVSTETVRNIESRRTTPRVKTAKAIADLYECEVTDIWPVTDEKAAA